MDRLLQDFWDNSGAADKELRELELPIRLYNKLRHLKPQVEKVGYFRKVPPRLMLGLGEITEPECEEIEGVLIKLIREFCLKQLRLSAAIGQENSQSIH